MPMLRRALLAGVWIWTGIVSLGPYPIPASLDLLARTGLTGSSARIALFGGAFADLLLGAALMVGWRTHLVCAIQIGLMGIYTAIISVTMPELWLDPFAPIAKNAAVLSATLALMERKAR